jgi:hypothetical protein
MVGYMVNLTLPIISYFKLRNFPNWYRVNKTDTGYYSYTAFFRTYQRYQVRQKFYLFVYLLRTSDGQSRKVRWSVNIVLRKLRKESVMT